MKAWIFAACAALFLFGIGSLLLRTSQAPLDVMNASPKALPVDAPETVALTSGPAATPSEVMSQDAFRALSEETLRALPTKEYLLSTKTADPFTAPAAVVKAGIAMHLFVEAVHQQPTLEEDALHLLKNCAAGGQYPDSVRALCVSYYRRLKKGSFPETFAPPFIRALADKLGT